MLQLQPIVHSRLLSTRAGNDHWLDSGVNARSASLGHSSIPCVDGRSPGDAARPSLAFRAYPPLRRAEENQRKTCRLRTAAFLPSHSNLFPVSTVPYNDNQRMDCSAWFSDLVRCYTGGLQPILSFSSPPPTQCPNLALYVKVACRDRRGKEKYAINKCQVAAGCSIGGKEKFKLKEEECSECRA